MSDGDRQWLSYMSRVTSMNVVARVNNVASVKHHDEKERYMHGTCMEGT